jgi:hypothetical protein
VGPGTSARYRTVFPALMALTRPRQPPRSLRPSFASDGGPIRTFLLHPPSRIARQRGDTSPRTGYDQIVAYLERSHQVGYRPWPGSLFQERSYVVAKGYLSAASQRGCGRKTQLWTIDGVVVHWPGRSWAAAASVREALYQALCFGLDSRNTRTKQTSRTRRLITSGIFKTAPFDTTVKRAIDGSP